jgi:methyl-accepting chemotaxis protein
VREIADGMSSDPAVASWTCLSEVSAQSSGVIAKMEAMTEVVNQTFSLLSQRRDDHQADQSAVAERLHRSGAFGGSRPGLSGGGVGDAQFVAQLGALERANPGPGGTSPKRSFSETRDVVNQMAMRDMACADRSQG